MSGVVKTFGAVTAVAGVDLEVAGGEFFSMLGPSGSGKTTVLRLIAGFEQPSSGRIELAGADVTSAPPFARDVNTVFQDYALFPHMNVAQNVEYGLAIRKVGKAERRERVREALRTVRLEGFETRRPAQMSGGQRQRVALARALVNRPSVLLLDEPLGALDLKLREEMQVELKQIQREVGITFIFVTHDQSEALSMSDRIAVFDAGRVEQVGTPRELYERPATRFVADFVGTTNLVDDAGATYSVRPERIRLLTDDAAAPATYVVHEGTVAETVYLGSQTRYLVDVGAPRLLSVLTQNDSSTGSAARGDRVRVAWDPAHSVLVSAPGDPR